MSTDLETGLRREFDAARAPSTLTFSPESIVLQGHRSIRRRRLLASGSAAMAVGLIALGTTLVTRPDNSARPLPAASTASAGVVTARAAFAWGHSDIEFNLGSGVQPDVRYSAVGPDGRRHDLGTSSVGRPGQKPVAVWKSGMVEGHPVTIGLFLGSAPDAPVITFADGISYGIGSQELKGTGFTMFYIDYTVIGKEPARPSQIASIRYSRTSGSIDGVEGGHELTGQVLTLSRTLSVDVVLRTAGGGRTTVFGQTHLKDGDSNIGFDLSAATTDPRGVAVATGRAPTIITTNGHRQGVRGTRVAAGILPAGASGICMFLSSNDAVCGGAVSSRLPDGRVIFAANGDFLGSGDSGKDVVKSVIWAYADGTVGRVTLSPAQGR